MKANELMIGDWVLVKELDYSNLTNVISEYQHQLRLKDFAEMYNAGEYKKYEPIPLTPEILEKNGFGRIDGKGTDFLIKGFLYWSSFAKRIFVQGHPNQIDWIDVCECQYVHELQHALKLCGIEKEIIL